MLHYDNLYTIGAVSATPFDFFFASMLPEI